MFPPSVHPPLKCVSLVLANWKRGFFFVFKKHMIVTVNGTLGQTDLVIVSLSDS